MTTTMMMQLMIPTMTMLDDNFKSAYLFDEHTFPQISNIIMYFTLPISSLLTLSSHNMPLDEYLGPLHFFVYYFGTGHGSLQQRYENGTSRTTKRKEPIVGQRQ